MNRRRQRRREAGRGKSRTVTRGKTAVEKKWMWNNRERHRLWRTQLRVFHVNASSPWQRAAGSWTALMRRRTDRKSKNILPSRRNPPEKVDCSKSSSGVCTKEGMFPFFPSGIPVVPHPYRHLRHFEDSWVCLLPRFPNRYLPSLSRLVLFFPLEYREELSIIPLASPSSSSRPFYFSLCFLSYDIVGLPPSPSPIPFVG